MQPLTFSSNKHFIPVANKPLIFYPIETVIAAGIKDIAITYNPGYLEQVKNLVGDGSKWGAKFTFVLQERPVGLANIVEVCEKYLEGESFAFHLGDNIFTDGIKEAVDYFVREKPNGLVTMTHHPENRRLGVPYFDKRNRLIKYVEKPAKPPHDFAIPGIYFADCNFFKCFKGKDRIKASERGEFEIPTAYQWMIDHGFRVDVIEYKGKWLDPGKFGDWIYANQFLLDTKLMTNIEGHVDKDSVVENRVAIGKGSKVINSQIRGPVAIGEKVVIENSYIGPFTSVSNNSIISDSHIENSVVMDGVKISGVESPIDSSLIGAGSTIVDNSGPTKIFKFFIGNKCQIEL